MFEELGYKHDTFTSLQGKKYIRYWKNITIERVDIYFDINSKKICVDRRFESMEIDMPTFSAIYQQVKELGWLEE